MLELFENVASFCYHIFEPLLLTCLCFYVTNLFPYGCNAGTPLIFLDDKL